MYYSDYILKINREYVAWRECINLHQIRGQNFNVNLQKGTEAFTDNVLLVQGALKTMNNGAASVEKRLAAEEVIIASIETRSISVATIKNGGHTMVRVG